MASVFAEALAIFSKHGYDFTAANKESNIEKAVLSMGVRVFYDLTAEMSAVIKRNLGHTQVQQMIFDQILQDFQEVSAPTMFEYEIFNNPYDEFQAVEVVLDHEFYNHLEQDPEQTAQNIKDSYGEAFVKRVAEFIAGFDGGDLTREQDKIKNLFLGACIMLKYYTPNYVPMPDIDFEGDERIPSNGQRTVIRERGDVAAFLRANAEIPF